ncbi:MAG: hypothetical protein ABI880_09350 [Acidobacteriota bacterium]
MSITVLSVARRAAATIFIVTASATATAFAQAPTLAVSQTNVVPGSSVTATVTGPANEYFAVVGSSVGAGGSYAGQPLAVGADYVVVVRGTLDGTGHAVVSLTPPFLMSVLDRAYFQAATSSSPLFTTLALSSGVVLRNNDLVSGLTGATGPAGPMGPSGTTGAMGPAGPIGPAGPAGLTGIAGPAGVAGAAGAAGPTGLPGVGFRTDCADTNIAVWDSGLSQWVCSSTLANLTAALTALTARVASLEDPVDLYLNSLDFGSQFQVGTSFAVQGNNGGNACIFGAFPLVLQVFGSDNNAGYPGGRVLAYDFNGSAFIDVSGSIPVNTVQVLARCASGRPYVVK